MSGKKKKIVVGEGITLIQSCLSYIPTDLKRDFLFVGD